MMPPRRRRSLTDKFFLTADDVWSSRLGLFAAGTPLILTVSSTIVGAVDETTLDRVEWLQGHVVVRGNQAIAARARSPALR